MNSLEEKLKEMEAEQLCNADSCVECGVLHGVFAALRLAISQRDEYAEGIRDFAGHHTSGQYQKPRDNAAILAKLNGESK